MVDAVPATTHAPFLRQPIEAQREALTADLRIQWLAFNRELKQGKLTHLDYDKETQALTWRTPKADKQPAHDQAFYEQLPFCTVVDVCRLVNRECQFLSALTPLQPRYAKKVADADSLMAVVLAQALNHGNLVMAHQRHPVLCAGGDLPVVPAPGLAQGGQRPHQQCHRGAADLPHIRLVIA